MKVRKFKTDKATISGSTLDIKCVLNYSCLYHMNRYSELRRREETEKNLPDLDLDRMRWHWQEYTNFSNLRNELGD